MEAVGPGAIESDRMTQLPEGWVLVLRCFSGFGGSPVVNGAAEFSFFRDVLTIYGATKPVTTLPGFKLRTGMSALRHELALTKSEMLT